MRKALTYTLTGLAVLLVLFPLVAPDQIGQLTPLAFLRIPVEGLLGVALVLLLRGRARTVAAISLGALLGLLAIVKVVSLGFSAVLDRQFDPVLDWPFIDAGYVYVRESAGKAKAVGLVVGAIVLCGAVLALTGLAMVRLTRLVSPHRRTAFRTVAVLAAAWLALTLSGLHLVRNVPMAAHPYYDSLVQVRHGFQDRGEFAGEIRADAFRGMPGQNLLTSLRGKDVIVAFVESYGVVALDNPDIAPQVSAVLDAGTRELNAAGFASRSAFLTSPTAGGGSWLAQSTLLSGLWVDNQQRYVDLMKTDRLTLNGAFRRAGWRTVGVMPGVIQDWPEGTFYGNDQIYAAKDLNYRGPKFSFATMPDQYALSAFERFERERQGRGPIMAEIPLISSHAPWNPVPPLLDWDRIGDGSVYHASAGASDPADVVLQRDVHRVRADYRHAVEYSLNSLISYVQRYGDDNLVLVFLGDHQPAPVVAGQGASRNVPVSIVAHDPKVIQRVAAWGWQDGLRPTTGAPVWRMDSFRDRFLHTFS